MITDKIGKTVYYIFDPTKPIIVKTKILFSCCFLKDGTFWTSDSDVPAPSDEEISSSIEYTIDWPVGHDIELNNSYDRVYERLEDARAYIRANKLKRKRGYRAHKKVMSYCHKTLSSIFRTWFLTEEEYKKVVDETYQQCLRAKDKIYT